MTVVLFVLGVCLVAVSGRLVARAVAVPRMNLKEHLREISDYGFDAAIAAAPVTGMERLRARLRVLAQRTGRYVMRTFPAIPALSPSELTAGGYYDTTPEIIHGYRCLAALGTPAVMLLLVIASGKISAIGILLLLTSAGAGWILPSFVIRKQGKKRLAEIDRRLPEMIDVLIATVEAGMGFAASLNLVADRFQGPLGEELKLTMKQQTLGMSIGQALTEFSERCDTPSLRAFVRTASRGESLGVSIGPVLRELSADQRRRHRQTAREKMQKAPIKMLFPLMFLIFPALMIVLMFPAGYSLVHNLGGII
jgi:tight adherence protein C